MNKNILVAVPVSLIAVAAFLLSVRSSVNAESLIGYASVFALLSMVALEYRINWKRPFGRS
jgi:predicted membrane-bound mannosyltransferase